jgi:hypothetical protein
VIVAGCLHYWSVDSPCTRLNEAMDHVGIPSTCNSCRAPRRPAQKTPWRFVGGIASLVEKDSETMKSELESTKLLLAEAREGGRWRARSLGEYYQKVGFRVGRGESAAHLSAP